MLSSSPLLTVSEFNEACNSLITGFDQCKHLQAEWQSVEFISQYETSHLRITKMLLNVAGAVRDAGSEDAHDELDEDDNDDDDEVLSLPIKTQAFIHYDVFLSPVYRVPVLYISILDSQHRYPPTMDTLYSQLIPSSFKAQTEHGGIIGGVTITDHPASNRPVFFIHPCQTAEVMQASTSRRDITPHEYLMVWVGALGKCVGLNVPLALAANNEEQTIESQESNI
ncbi:hypothetical protein GQ44DRAFT_327396 [Phaeosphaeriaceae sp. PMI808]|nr:hypothetical protein GQ44DRAFT_327396 [Phaeosphaeriaceae sp. PMI808]